MTGDHTPGPWVAIRRDKTSNPPFIMREGDSSGWIGQTCTWMGLDEAESNARLFAGGPEMLAALKYAVDNPDFDSTSFDAKARAAIAKVEGRTE